MPAPFQTSPAATDSIETPTAARALLLKRLRWSCRRGMREMDMLLDRWLERHFERANSRELAAFQRLLAGEDDQLWDWMLGKGGPNDAEEALVLSQICQPAAPDAPLRPRI